MRSSAVLTKKGLIIRWASLVPDARIGRDETGGPGNWIKVDGLRCYLRLKGPRLNNRPCIQRGAGNPSLSTSRSHTGLVSAGVIVRLGSPDVAHRLHPPSKQESARYASYRASRPTTFRAGHHNRPLR